MSKKGMIIAARLGEDATVKTYTHRDGEVVLVPANPAEQEIVVKSGDDFAIIGKVCGVFRPFQEVHQHEELALAE
jgi:SOS-response transcriptional repressors (RecA-mediated autopeptidases)